MVLRSGDRCQEQRGALRKAGKVVLLLLGAGPVLSGEWHPGRIQWLIDSAGTLHDNHAVVEMVGRNTLNPGSCHGHGRMGLKTSGTEHGDEHRSLIFANTAAVSEIHLGIVEGIALTLAHGYS